MFREIVTITLIFIKLTRYILGEAKIKGVKSNYY